MTRSWTEIFRMTNKGLWKERCRAVSRTCTEKRKKKKKKRKTRE